MFFAWTFSATDIAHIPRSAYKIFGISGHRMNFLHSKRPRAIASSGIFMLVLLALVLKGLLPAGFMPAPSKDGMMEMVICSGMGEKTILVPAGDAPASGHAENTDKVCAYQTVTGQKIILAPPSLLVPPPVLITAPDITGGETRLSQNAPSSFAARGPPSFV